MSSKRLTVYTDGSCSPNPGAGGWAFIAVLPVRDIYNCDRNNKTTNNIMEMTAVIEALKTFPEQKEFHIFSDSKYVINCAQGKWQRKKNLKLWNEYDKHASGKDVMFTWVKAHNGDHYNERVDKLARYGDA